MIVFDIVKGYGFYIYLVVFEIVDFFVGWVFIVFVYIYVGSCKFCGVDMLFIVNSLIYYFFWRLYIEFFFSGFLFDWNKRGYW